MGTTTAVRGFRAWPWVVTLALGVGVVLAPMAFQMFSRAPSGGQMIDEFRPYMTEAQIGGFQRDIRDIRAAVREFTEKIDPELARKGLSPEQVRTAYPSYVDLQQRWPGIDADMSDMLRTMRADLTDFAAVDALPPFPMFPWFFVVPGAFVIGVSIWGLVRSRRNRSVRGPVIAVVVIGLGIVLAPALFQMFTRAPEGRDMIDDFRPLMTTEKVQRIQGYFLVMGAGEGTLRNDIVPALANPGADGSPQLPAVEHFSERWPRISNQMAPMIGAMSDNVDNYAAVDALPPFSLFPWFFVVPGVLIVAFGLVASRSRRVIAARLLSRQVRSTP